MHYNKPSSKASELYVHSAAQKKAPPVAVPIKHGAASSGGASIGSSKHCITKCADDKDAQPETKPQTTVTNAFLQDALLGQPYFPPGQCTIC